jgi:hypothetical protein
MNREYDIFEAADILLDILLQRMNQNIIIK